jgi:hypothetical protein
MVFVTDRVGPFGKRNQDSAETLHKVLIDLGDLISIRVNDNRMALLGGPCGDRS